jgi:hypothetical protein
LDFKIDPDCFDTDSTKLFYTNTRVGGLTTELVGLNSVYVPRKINDSTFSILYIKDELKNAFLSFSLYKGKKWIKTFRNQPLKDLVFDEQSRQYIIQTDSVKVHFPKLRVYNVVLKVNDDKYKVAGEKKKFDFVYLNRPKEKVSIDFTIADSKGSYKFTDQSLESLPLDPVTGYRVINKKYFKQLKLSRDITKN